eukprot:364195-Chlamydomonas_euryale.AAC.11
MECRSRRNMPASRPAAHNVPAWHGGSTYLDAFSRHALRDDIWLHFRNQPVQADRHLGHLGAAGPCTSCCLELRPSLARHACAMLVCVRRDPRVIAPLKSNLFGGASSIRFWRTRRSCCEARQTDALRPGGGQRQLQDPAASGNQLRRPARQQCSLLPRP